MKIDKLLQDLKDILPKNVSYEVGMMHLDQLVAQNKNDVNNIIMNFGDAIGWIALSNEVILISNLADVESLDLNKLLELELFNTKTESTLRIKLLHDDLYSAATYTYAKCADTSSIGEVCITYEQSLVIRHDLQITGYKQAKYRIGYVSTDDGKFEPKYQQFIGFVGV